MISFKELCDHNSFEYNHLKAVEELLELAEVLQKKVLKLHTEKEPSDESIVEEIGDVQIRLNVLKEIYGEINVEHRISDKLTAYSNYNYVNI